MTKWHKQTYEMVAEVLRNKRGVADPDSDAAIMTLDSLTSSFAEIFRIDNPQFDEGRFRRAAGAMRMPEKVSNTDEQRPDMGVPERSFYQRSNRRRPEVRVRGHRREVR